MDEPALALAEYDRFLELWQDADDEYLPIAEDVRSRVAGLTSKTSRTEN